MGGLRAVNVKIVTQTHKPASSKEAALVHDD